MILDYHHYVCNKGDININDHYKEIFSTWEEIRLAAKARKKPNTKNSLKQKVKSLITQFSSLLSIMLQKAEIKRKALLSRQKSFKIT